MFSSGNQLRMDPPHLMSRNLLVATAACYGIGAHWVFDVTTEWQFWNIMFGSPGETYGMYPGMQRKSLCHVMMIRNLFRIRNGFEERFRSQDATKSKKATITNTVLSKKS